MKVHLPYGRQGVEVKLPDQAQVLLPERIPALAQPEEAVRQALRQPIGSPPLAERVLWPRSCSRRARAMPGGGGSAGAYCTLLCPSALIRHSCFAVT